MNGQVVEVYGNHPAVMLDEPRDRTLLDEPRETLVWDDRCRWYERSGAG